MKRKLVEKVLALTLVAAMTMGVAACGNEAGSGTSDDKSSASDVSAQDSTESSSGDAEAPGDQEQEDEPESAYTVLTDENGDVYDLGGVEIIIRDWWSTEEDEDKDKTAYEEAREEYIDWIQKTYNFKIKQIAISTWDSVPEDFANYATTGGDEYYLFILRHSKEAVAAMNSGLMYDLSTIDCLDFTEEKWGGEGGLHNLFTKKGGIYGMRTGDPYPTGGVYFNKRLLQEAGINPDDIYTYQENMEWTWDKFEELCNQIQADTDSDGVIDRYAMCSFSMNAFRSAVYSNGGEFVGLDENGDYYNALESDETIEALNWMLHMRETYEMAYPEGADWNYWSTAFVNGEAAFAPGDELYLAGNDYNNMADDYGFVCFPMGPKASDYTNCYQGDPYCIPACYDADKAWKIAFAYNLYTEPVPGYEDYEAWVDDFLPNFRDTEAVEYTVARMLKNGMVTYHELIPGLDLGNDVIYAINKDNTPAQQTEAIRNTWNTYIEEANK